MTSIRLPEINAPTADGQLRQLRSYLYQLTEQLNLALQSVDREISEQASAIAAAEKAAESDEGKLRTFNSVKALIIKSADIVNAYSEEITRQLDGVYVAQSDFGTYTEETFQKITENSDNITQLFRNLQTISDTVDGIEKASILANAYIVTGLLYYGDDGAPVYGLEIGQTNTVDGVESFNRFARFAANRLSFYDNNDVEVAYISDYRLVITNAEVRGTLVLGQFRLDTSNGLAIKWVGG